MLQCLTYCDPLFRLEIRHLCNKIFEILVDAFIAPQRMILEDCRRRILTEPLGKSRSKDYLDSCGFHTPKIG